MAHNRDRNFIACQFFVARFCNENIARWHCIRGIGAVGTAILGIVLFDESTEILKLVSLGLICTGIVGLKLAHG